MRLIIWLIVFITLNGQAQKKNLNVQVDSLFSEYNQPNTPGLAIAIVQDGNVLYQNGFGFANLEKNKLVDSATKFWIASVTKQFTAFGIYLLESQQKVDLQKSITYYIPELPALFEQVTVEQLVHHTSGIRDAFVLTALSKRPEDEYTNENVLKYLIQQKQLNFSPGTAFEYNNSGYVLLALVIERVSKESYPNFMKTSVFEPLGMTQTVVSGKYVADEKNAEGYSSKDFSNKPGTFIQGHFKGNTYGSTGIITTLKDLTEWEIFIQGKRNMKPLERARLQLLKTGKLNSGDYIAYAGGLEKFVYDERVVYEHFGADEGFKADILYFPKHNLSIIGFSNNTTNYTLTNNLYAIADIILGKSPQKFSSAYIEKDMLWEQSYFTKLPFPAYRHIKFYNGFVKVSETPGGMETNYFYDKNHFQTADPVSFASLQITKKELTILDSFYHQNRRLKAITETEKYDDASFFAGRYFSEELGISYEVVVKQGELLFEFVPGVQLKLHRLTNNNCIFNYYGANYIEFIEDEFLLSREGIHGLKFKKM